MRLLRHKSKKRTKITLLAMIEPTHRMFTITLMCVCIAESKYISLSCVFHSSAFLFRRFIFDSVLFFFFCFVVVFSASVSWADFFVFFSSLAYSCYSSLDSFVATILQPSVVRMQFITHECNNTEKSVCNSKGTTISSPPQKKNFSKADLIDIVRALEQQQQEQKRKSSYLKSNLPMFQSVRF